ncbi:hypothetical protein [Microbacterium sp. ZXX196]|uniref:Gp37-like protein n=1 Tax=Microbacterium sp. ZXX196 TaxID=2609291 RepID=UPI0012B7BA08|nr:hypothetical protein [Microbacterium sp. ZXX196]MTE24822.1 hypothetical protein [Microbacterium sp. ZXX196]
MRLDFTVHDASGAFLATVVPREVHVELLWNQVSFAELTFDDDDKAMSVLGEGSRVRVLVDGVAHVDGPVVGIDGSDTEAASEVVVTVEDDFRLFRNLGWQNPAQPLSNQSSEYKRYSGPLETVMKAACTDLSTRLGLGWVVPASTGLGSSVRVEFRMHPLTDKFTDLLTADQLTWTLRGGVVDVTAGELFPRVLTRESGIVGDFTWSLNAPTATRVVVGGEGEGTDRLFQGFTDTARETSWGFISEVFQDARMAQGETDLSPDGAEALAEGAGTVSVTADLNETSWFRFGAYQVGDLVHIQVGTVDTTEVITQVVIDDTPGDGLVVTPHIGAVEDTAGSRLARQVARLNKGLRDQRSSR